MISCKTLAFDCLVPNYGCLNCSGKACPILKVQNELHRMAVMSLCKEALALKLMGRMTT